MKTLLVLAAATLSFAALPAEASAKIRGCDYRLQSLTDAEIALEQAEHRGIGVAEARSQLARARGAAQDEGCFAPRPAPRVEPIRHDRDPHYERSDRARYEWFSHRERARARFERLIGLGYRRGLSRDEFCELLELRKHFGY